MWGAPLNVDIDVPSAILINAETGAVLYEKNAHTARYPGSITKVATALFVLSKRSSDLEAVLTVDSDSLAMAPERDKLANLVPSYRQEWDGTHMGLKIGEEMKVRDLLYGLMLASANDAANVLARYTSGNIPQFLQELHLFFKSHGILNTSFNNPHGLHHPDHFTTAYDMAMIARLAMQYPLFREIVKTVKYPRPDTNKQPSRPIVQHNKLLLKGKFYYPSCVGIKTGYHSHAGYTLVAAAEKEGRSLIVVLLGAKEMPQRYIGAVKLFEAGFAEKKVKRTLFAKGQDRYYFTSKLFPKSVAAGLQEDVVIEYYPSEEPKLQASLKWNSIENTIAQGDVLGRLEVRTPSGKTIAYGNLCALEQGDLCFSAKMQSHCKEAKQFFMHYRFAVVLALLLIPFLIIWRVFRKAR